MVSLLKNSTEFGLFVLESDDTFNDDWITDHAGDPGEADLATYTEGLEFFHLEDVSDIDSMGTHNFESEQTYMGWQVRGIGAGKKDWWTKQDDKQFLTFGGECDLTHLQYIQRAFKEMNISRSTIDSFLVWMTAADTYKTWYDEAGDVQSYCPIIWRGFRWGYKMTVKDIYVVLLTFEVVWS